MADGPDARPAAGFGVAHGQLFPHAIAERLASVLRAIHDGVVVITGTIAFARHAQAL
jgi:hypothetical protein